MYCPKCQNPLCRPNLWITLILMKLRKVVNNWNVVEVITCLKYVLIPCRLLGHPISSTSGGVRCSGRARGRRRCVPLGQSALRKSLLRGERQHTHSPPDSRFPRCALPPCTRLPVCARLQLRREKGGRTEHKRELPDASAGARWGFTFTGCNLRDATPPAAPATHSEQDAHEKTESLMDVQ